MKNRIIIALLLCTCSMAGFAQGEDVFTVKAKTEEAPVTKHRTVTLPKYDTAGLNFLVIDSMPVKGDTLKFGNEKIILRGAVIQTARGADLKQHQLKSNVLDETACFILRYARMNKQTPVIMIHSIYSNGSVRDKEWFVYQVKFLP